jgi:hypothetical protein
MKRTFFQSSDLTSWYRMAGGAASPAAGGAAPRTGRAIGLTAAVIADATTFYILGRLLYPV